jgi:thioredoxin family protein/AhpC/TSA family protein
MDDYLLHDNLVRAPEFASGDWLNAPQRITLAALRGQPLLVYLWDYTSIHCLRTLPYLRKWQERYEAADLQVLGVHTPAYSFGRERLQVELAVKELDVRYPVLLDNEFKTWNAYGNTFWPARYLIDSQGFIRYQDYGEGGYTEFERALQALLREMNPSIDLPPVMRPLRDEDRPEVLRQRPTPELRGGLQQGALGNPEGYGGHLPVIYRLPKRRVHGAFYVAGAWRADNEYLAYQGTTEGIIQLPYEAAEVNAVLSPHPETVERYLHPDAVSIEIWQDDLPIPVEHLGADVTEDGRLFIHRPRVYNLIRNPGHEQHELTLRIHARGVALYSFSFIGGLQVG